MALDAFLNFDGKIKGSVTQKGREGKIRVYAVDHQMEAVADSATGFPGKTVMPGALIATKGVDMASTPLQKAMQENTTFDSVKLEMWRMPPQGGVEENHYTIVMTDAQIKSIRLVMRFNKVQEDSLIPEVEEVAFSYKAISFTYKGAEGSNNAGPFQRDEFNDDEDSIEDAIKSGLKDGAKDLGAGLGAAIKDALKPEQPPAGG